MIQRLLSLTLALILIACATSQTSTVVSSTIFQPDRTTILNLRLEKVLLSGVTMQQALLRLADGISNSTDGKIKFSFGIENSRDPMAKVPLKDPGVKLEASNVSLGEVLNNLCRQSGWSYRKYPKGIMFTDDRRFFTRGTTSESFPR